MKIVKTFEHAGMKCAVVYYKHPDMGNDPYMRKIMGVGHFCGYVNIPKENPAYGIKNEMDVPHEWQDVHGGITFSGEYPALGPGWWLGFDCNHLSDMDANWDKEKVAAEVLSFAKVLHKGFPWKKKEDGGR